MCVCYLLQHGDDRRLPLLQEVQHHEDVGIRREASSGRVANVAALQAQRAVSRTDAENEQHEEGCELVKQM